MLRLRTVHVCDAFVWVEVGPCRPGLSKQKKAVPDYERGPQHNAVSTTISI